ncbi:MAG: NAD+ synthase [Armatimonadota bacterium]
MRITIAQLNPTVGDLAGNTARALEVLEQAAHDKADLVVFSELYLVGYPPRDLLNRCWFVDRIQGSLDQLIRASRLHPQTGILVGVPLQTGKQTGPGLYNGALLIHNGEIIGEAHKCLLPTYDVFDEDRYFERCDAQQPIEFKGERLGITICEDAWNDPELWPRQRMYDFDPVEHLAQQGATILINISASPFSVGKEDVRYWLISRHAQRHNLPFIYANQVGGNDELIFDGRSFAFDAEGNPTAVFPAFEEYIGTVDTAEPGKASLYHPQEQIASVHDALVVGIRDYLRKCGFTKCVIGLSGGIDSAVTCALAAEALGTPNVLGMGMPSSYSSTGSIDDAQALAHNLGIRFELVPIKDIVTGYMGTLERLFEGTPPGVAEENVQSRIRGNLLMAMSNKYGSLVLTTGNKSEVAVGYCTLYGDMSGGLSVLSDVPKTMVYELARYINREREVIPESSITKPPSAELRPNQTDQDTLPPYDILDQIIQLYVEEDLCASEIVERGFAQETVKWVLTTIDRNEYKRRQAAPGLKVTSKAFGVGRRMPVAAKIDVGL